MGYEVKAIRLYSMDDNKVHPLALPANDPMRQKGFEKLLHDIRMFDLSEPFPVNPRKCFRCIYNPLCDMAS